MRKLRVLMVTDYVELGEDICELLTLEGYDSLLETALDFDNICLLVAVFQPDLLVIGGYANSDKQIIARHFSARLPLIVSTAKLERCSGFYGLAAEDTRFLLSPFLLAEFLSLVVLLLRPLVDDLKWLDSPAD